MTREEIKQELGDDKYINSFKARRYIEFLLEECDKLEEVLTSRAQKIYECYQYEFEDEY